MLPPLPSGQILHLATSPGVLGGVVWPAAATLCRYLAQNHCDIGLERAHCVELGSGTGAVGLYAAALGAASVVLTDCRPPPESAMYTTDGSVSLPPGGSDSVLELLRRNVEANTAALRSTPQVMELDWNESDDADRVVAETEGPTDGFDIVFASDVTHFTAMHRPLASTVARLLRPGTGVCLLSHQERLLNLGGKDMQMRKFEQVAHAEGLDVESLPLLPQSPQTAGAESSQNRNSMMLLRHCSMEKRTNGLFY